MARGTRRADIKNRLTPRRLSWLGWFWGRLLLIGKYVALVVLVVGACLWVWGQGYAVQAGNWVHTQFASAAASAGMQVRDVVVEGRNRIDTETLKTAIGVEPGDPIFGIDIQEMHARLTAISWVKDVQVRRAWPDRVIVSLTERLPVALWADANGGPAVIDAEGVVLTRINTGDFGQLLVVEGEGCAPEAGNIIALLKAQPDIAVRVKKAVYVSGRRWDVIMDGGAVLRLPEDDPGYALARASRAQLQEKIFDQELKSIDLRQSDRIILESKPGSKRDLLLKGGNPV